jgi:hypothetical protein
MVGAHCDNQGITYVQTSLPAALVIGVSYLNEVGLNARHTFRCPIASRLGEC